MNKILELTGNKDNWINGQWVQSESTNRIDVLNPQTGKVIGSIPDSIQDDIDSAVINASKAFESWRKLNVRERGDILESCLMALKRDRSLFADLISLDNGKILEEAEGSIQRGLEVIEYAISYSRMPQGISGPVGTNITCKMYPEPLGVTAGITPFNFPIMVPLWMIPLTLIVGNTFILKPSEQAPFTALKLAQVFNEAGLPDGVLNIVNGGQTAVKSLIENKNVKAIGFVGSSKVAKIVYEGSAIAGKRSLCLGGAKNHMVLMPDAAPKSSVEAIYASSMGSAGQRCMAGSVLIAVGDVDEQIKVLKAKCEETRLGFNMGSVISQESRTRIESYIEAAEKAGAKILVDGRIFPIPEGKEKGFWIGPTLIDNVKPDMTCACDEIFGPVLSIIRVDSLDEAIEIENNSGYGNAAVIFTTSGSNSEKFSNQSSAGMIGINIGVPVPRDPFSFGGWNESKFGHGDITGESGIAFWSNLKKVTTRWPNEDKNWKKYF